MLLARCRTCRNEAAPLPLCKTLLPGFEEFPTGGILVVNLQPSVKQLVWIAPPPTKCGLSCATYSTGCLRSISRNEPFLPGCDGVLCVFEFGKDPGA